MAKLDSRPARNLTSREQAKILCGLLGGMALNTSVSDLRAALRYVRDMTKNPTVAHETTASGIPLLVFSTLGGIVSCLAGDFGDKATFEALDWVIETDQVWEQMQAVAVKTREVLAGKEGEQLRRAVDELRQELE